MITKKINQLFKFAKKSKLKASDGSTEGEYPFLTSSQVITKRTNNPQFFEECLVFGNGGGANIHYLNKPFATTSHCYIAEQKDEGVNIKYVYYYLSGNLHLLERGFKGAGLKNISSKYIANLDIPILPIETQNKIVALLDKASALMQKREESIALLDELLRAQYLEMFGEAPTNKKNWDSAELGTFLDFMTSGSRGWAKYYRETGDKFLRINNLGYNNLNLEELKFIKTPNTAEAKRTKIQPKDVLLSITADLGRTAVVPDDIGDTFINQHIALLRFNDKLNPYFISAYISSSGGRHLLERYNKGAAKSGLNFNDIKSLNVHIPPIELQNQFETIYHNIQSQKETLNQSKIELEHLFNSLIQEAFKGELEVSKEDAKKKDSIMSEIKKQEGEKVDITNLDLATYLGIPDEIISTQENWMFDLMSLDEFYQFLLKDNFTKEESFTLQDIEEKLHHFFYHGGDTDFPNASWQLIIFKFLEAKPPLLEQIFEEETATVKLKLTDETFKA